MNDTETDKAIAMPISRHDMLKCHERIQPHINRTPVLTSRLLNEISGASLFFKCENFQRTGSFKMRGATNAVLCIPDSSRANGVVCHSSGNFAQAVALAAQSAGVKAWIVMPSNAPDVKVNAVRGYGGEVIMCEPTIEAREAEALGVASERDASLLHPSNDLAVITGQGTAGMELLADQPDLDYLLTPVGGGGLVAGCSLAAHHFGTSCATIGAEPRIVNDAFRSLQSGKIESNETTHTIADGLRTVLGSNNFPIIQKHVERIICVQEDEIIQAMRLIWERMKIVCEPSSAVPVAALLREKSTFAGKKLGIVLSGGNVDMGKLPFVE